jgi:periplasmic protein TonB
VRDSFLRSPSSQRNSTDNLIARIRENFRDALRPARWRVSSANGAPLHLPSVRGGPRAGRAQGISFLTHAGVIGVLAVFALHPNRPQTHPAEGTTSVFPPLKFPMDLLARNVNAHPDPGTGSGGGRTPIPATAGNLVPVSSIQLVRPSLPPQQESHLPEPPTILDPSVAAVLTPVDKIGLPWMRIDTRSPGPGDSNTIGNGPGKTMGDGPTDGPGGLGVSGREYKIGTIVPTCLYCPNPGYTDEARESKLQGMVTLVVLVSTDGRATDIRIAKGLGLGLDERARDAVRDWRFTPARDPARHPVPAWITIEVIFRLF